MQTDQVGSCLVSAKLCTVEAAMIISHAESELPVAVVKRTILPAFLSLGQLLCFAGMHAARAFSSSDFDSGENTAWPGVECNEMGWDENSRLY